MSTQYNYKHLTGTQIANIATGVGMLHSIVVNTSAAGAITVTDASATATTATMASLKASIAEATYLYDCVFGTGLKVNVAANSDITVTWKQTF